MMKPAFLVAITAAAAATGQQLQGGHGGGQLCPMPGNPSWGGSGTYCLADGNLYQCTGTQYDNALVQTCHYGCVRNSAGVVDQCRPPPPPPTPPIVHKPYCPPVNRGWGNAGLYCLDNDLYQCNARTEILCGNILVMQN